MESRASKWRPNTSWPRKRKSSYHRGKDTSSNLKVKQLLRCYSEFGFNIGGQRSAGSRHSPAAWILGQERLVKERWNLY